MKEFERPNNDPLFEEQLEFFFIRMESDYNISLIPEDEKDSDISWKEKTLQAIFPETPLDSFFIYLKENKPTLFKALQHHSLFTGKQKSKKKMSRKNSRKEKKDKERKRDMPIIAEESHEEHPSEHQRNCLLGCLLTKSIVDGTLQSQLIALAMLLHTFLETDSHFHSIPVGNILGAVFQTELSSHQIQKTDFSKLNPFQSCLRYLLEDDEPERRPGNRSTRGDSASQSTFDDRHSEIGSLYAPSNVESVQAEHGTETASIADMTEQDHNHDDENADDDEELLAQALALSLGAETLISSDNPKPNMPSLSESALSKIPSQSLSFGKRTMSPTSQTFSENEKHLSQNLPPFPAVHPLSTFGPFCESTFWKTLFAHCDVATRHSLVWVPLQSAIVALLVNLGCGVDYAECPQSFLSNIAHEDSNSQKKSILPSLSPGSSRSFVAALAAAASDKKSPGTEMNTPFPTLPLAAIPLVSPHPVTFLIIDLLFEMIIPRLLSHQSDFGEESQSFRYFLTWFLCSLLKLVRTNFTVISSLSISPASLGLGKTNEEFQKPLPTLSDRLLKHILLCIGSDVFQPPGDVLENRILDPSMTYRHSLRILGIDALIAGYSIFYPANFEREIFLSSLFESTPVCYDATTGLSPFSPLPNVYSAFCELNQFENDISKEVGYYRTLLLQKICLRLSLNDCSIPTTSDLTVNSSESDDKQKILAHLRTILPREANEDVLERVYETVTDGQITGQPLFQSMRLLSAMGLQTSEDPGEENRAQEIESFPENGSDNSDQNEITSSLEKVLLNRLRSPHLLKDVISANSTPFNSLFWGEISLLLKIQHKYITDFVNTSLEDTPSNLEFDSSQCSEHLQLTNEGRTVIQNASKTWSTVLATTKFEPNSGEHTWAIKLRKCDKGHVFLGIATAGASVDTYVGGDEYGWGLIGTRTLWHNRTKIKTSFGEGFSARATVYIRYNSNTGQLFYSKNLRGCWALAFENIPKVPIYPAVSLYQKDDSVSLMTTNINTSALELQSIDEIPRLFSTLIPFLVYASTIFDEVEKLLNLIESSNDHVLKFSILNHPFLTCLLPSLTAGILLSKHPTHQSAFLSVHLLPHLTLLVKRVALLHEIESPSLNDPQVFGFVGDISGKWNIKSGAAGSSIPAQEYWVHFDCTPIDSDTYSNLFDSEEKSSNSSSSLPLRLVGEGRGGSSNFDVEGLLYGTRVKFQESWTLGGNCLVEGRLSLDGGSFVGKFKDMKTGSIGTLQAFHQSSRSMISHNFLLKIALLLGTTAGKLTANLVTGMEVLPSLDIFDSAQVPAPNSPHETDTSLTTPEDSKDDNELTDDPKTESSNDQANHINLYSILQRWTLSPLFSGGLRNETSFHDALAFQLVSYLNLCPPESQTASLSHQCVELKNWWFHTIFFNLEKYCRSRSDSLSTCGFIPQSSSEEELTNRFDDSLYLLLQSNTGMGKRLDEHLSRYCGLSALCKLGGEPMQVARRRVLSALLYQSGCLSLCYAEDKIINLLDKDVLYKPHSLLLDIWRAGQKVIEHAIRIKQATGISYPLLSQDICKKAELLLFLHPCEISQNVCAQISQHSDVKVALSSDEVQTLVTKVLSEAIEFFQVSVVELTHLRSALFKSALKAYSRIAGFRSILLLLSKISSSNKYGDLATRLPSQSTLIMQPTVIEYLLPALFSKLPLGSDLNLIDTSEILEDPSFLTNSPPIYSGDGGGYPIGHFNDSLLSVSKEFMVQLRQSFEGVYELITQLIQRSTWSGDRDGQCIALSSWSIPIIPEDHAFLNRIGIFRVLQTVLDGARASIQRVQYHSTANPQAEGVKYVQSLLYEFINNSNQRLTQLALRIIHSLASQVASSKTSSDVFQKSLSLNLQRYPSGPETLSQSLFDMLYSELYNCMKNIMALIHGELPTQLRGSKSLEGQDELEGEKYAYRILRLLYSVSESTVCQRYLSTPKWLTLLVASVGFGDLAVQRRLMRLIRRLLISLTPQKVKLFIHETGLFSRSEEILLSDKALDEDDIESLTAANDADESVQKLLTLFLKASVLILPESDESTDYMNVLRQLSSVPGGTVSLTAESIALFRLLEDLPAWKPSVVSALRNPLRWVSGADKSSWENCSDLRMIAAVMGVLGGHIDRLRVGGTVTLKPFSLVSSNETFALRLASVSHSSGMLVAKSTSTVEVVLMERSRKVVKGVSGSSPFNTQYALSLSGPPPIRTVKMNIEDVMAAPDIPHPPDFFDVNLLTDCLTLLANFCLPYVQDFTSPKHDSPRNQDSPPVDSGAFSALDDGNDDDEDDDDEDDGLDNSEKSTKKEKETINSDEQTMSDLEALKLYVSTSTFRAISEYLQFNLLEISKDFDRQTLISNLLCFAIRPVSLGGLSEIEIIAERYASLWDAYVMSGQSGKSDESMVDWEESDGAKDIQALKTKLRMSRGLAEEPSSSSRGIPANLLAAMMSGPSAAEANHAREQMMEMGFPREWCEFALRKCRYNVELAINLCFEHGSEMNQLIAEDAALASTANSARSGAGNPSRFPRPLGMESMAARLAGTRRSESSSGRHQLMSMGFPPNWCTRALATNHNDVDAALSWILSHGEELIAGDETKDSSESKEGSSPTDSDFGPNPISCVSGSTTLSPDLSFGNGTTSGFPSVGCRGYHVISGKWYYEINLTTAGCMQFGWVDLAYEGSADQGQGVGDDAHSWAYDGWRKLKWHDLSTSWGSKWSPGDVIGVAVDMDNLTMTFSLNGFTEEIGMGLAFSNFSFHGGVYPCASFNRNEKFQFNFGYSSFKFMPEGYRGYIEHVQDCLSANSLRLQAMLLFAPSNDQSSLVKSNDSIFFEDCIEEHRGESDFMSHRRYFLPDDSLRMKQIERNSHHLAGKIAVTPIPKDKGKILKLFSQFSVELCILYSRLIILRLLTAASRNNTTETHSLTYDILMPPNAIDRNLRNLFYIIRQTSLTTLRTRTYLQTLSILPPSSLPPSNLGSILMSGGAPMLFSIQVGVSELISNLRKSTPSIFDYLLDLINTETLLSTRREYSAEWKAEGGIVPVIYYDATSIDIKDKEIPSLSFAWWLSIILIEKIIIECTSLKSSGSDDYSMMMNWIKKLVSAWAQTLNSPVIAVKLCGIRLLSSLIQELYFGECACPRLSSELDSLILQLIPLSRIEKLVLFRMEHEKSVQPICSEYLQNLIDFAITIRSVVNYSNENKLFPDQSLSLYPPSTSETSNSVEEFNWDSIYGSLMSDDGWEVWTGTVRQLESDFVKIPVSNRPTKPDQIPPPLLPGAKVIRADRQQPDRGNRETATGLESARNSFLSLLNDRNNSANESETKEDIGTILEITDYYNNELGSGRIVQWEDGTTEKVRWGANGIYDVTHVTLDSSGTIQMKYPPPLSEDKRAAKSGFASDSTFGIILRLRSLPIHENDEMIDVTGRFDGLMEWPEFNAVVYVTGEMFVDGHWTLTEQKLIAGAEHSDWTVRFGQPHWQSGTMYDLSLPRFADSDDTTDGRGRYLLGQFQYNVDCFSDARISIIGDIKIQQSKLFTFDPLCHASSISVSHDQLAAACVGGEGKCCAFASVGFSSGVHYWELKIEQCELGNIFVGVAEKPPRDQGPPNFKRWQGYGFVNMRLSFRNTGSNLSGEKVYGDLFQTGDTVGVLLDMNRGRLSFFLDAMKYGEHMLIDLGEAFDGLTNGSSHRVHPKTYYPVVGFKRAGDRVTITPRWLSSTGHYNSYQEFKNISRAWNLLSSWSDERPSTTPQGKDLWIYREAWRDWLRWKSNRYMKVRPRCHALNLLVGLDISPRACVDASIRLGLPAALYHGDRIVFLKSCGRVLESKEEAVVLGSFRGQLWYRFDSQSNTGVLVEGSGLAWCLAAHEVEDIQLIKRGNIQNILPSELIDVELCRLPVFRGGLLRVIYESGAVMREGIEIDSSDHTGTVEHGDIVYALERRINSSNIARYRVFYKGTFGWISERIRGGNEEFMVMRITPDSPTQLSDFLDEVRNAISSAGLSYRLSWKDVSTPLEAIREWESSIIDKGYEYLLGEVLSENCRKESSESFEKYLELSTSYDGITNWPVEYDMLLTEFISRISSKLGQSPFNLPTSQIVTSIKLLEENSPLLHISPDRIIARASIIRMANVVIGYSLPFFELSLPEEKWQGDIFGTPGGNIEISQNIALLAKKKDQFLSKINNDVNWLGDNYNQLVMENRFIWQPPCVSRRFRTKRRLLFTQTKRLFWENIIDATTTPTPLHQDEYEDPREIKVIRINRIKATHAKLTSITSASDRLSQSVFGQLHKEMRSWPASSFRRSYVGKGHGGQKRAFKVKFLGEGVNDYGGPYRAVFEQIVDEVQCDTVVGQKKSDRCLLPLLVPCANRSSGVGSNQDKFLLNSSPSSPLNQELMQFFGKLTGTALRHTMNMGLDLSCLFWRPLVRLPISRAHLETVDLLSANSLASIEKLGLQLESNSDAGYDRSYIPKEWSDLNFSVTSADGTKSCLVPGGEDIQLNLGNWRDYILLVERHRLKETSVMFRSFREGLSSVIPVDLFPVFTPVEMEEMFSGCVTVDIKLLKQCTEYDGLDPNSQLVSNFWSVLEEMTDEERTLFLRFVWARSRMPSSTQDLLMNFKLQAVHGEAQTSPDLYLPHAQTCFFSLGLPPYSTKEILREKLLYAIHNSPNMDADVRLHNAEGWT